MIKGSFLYQLIFIVGIHCCALCYRLLSASFGLLPIPCHHSYAQDQYRVQQMPFQMERFNGRLNPGVPETGMQQLNSFWLEIMMENSRLIIKDFPSCSFRISIPIFFPIFNFSPLYVFSLLTLRLHSFLW